jgi:hypothetical protein
MPPAASGSWRQKAGGIVGRVHSRGAPPESWRAAPLAAQGRRGCFVHAVAIGFLPFFIVLSSLMFHVYLTSYV